MGALKYLDPRPIWQLVVISSVCQIGIIFLVSLWLRRNAFSEQERRNSVRVYDYDEYKSISKKHPLNFRFIKVKYRDESIQKVILETSYTIFGNQTIVSYDGLGNEISCSTREFANHMVIAFIAPMFLIILSVNLFNLFNMLTFYQINLPGLGVFIENTSRIYMASLYIGLIVSQAIMTIENLMHKRWDRFYS